MIVNTKDLVSMSEANQNFSQVAKRVDESGSVIVLKNNKPKYLIIEFSYFENEYAPDEDVLNISKALIKKNRAAYEVLAK